MDVFLLGAGRPARGEAPSALKKIAMNTRALDWQIHSFDLVKEPLNFHYLGGYQIEKVIDRYPSLHFTVVPDWKKHGILHTLLQAPYSQQPVVISYSDTIFRTPTIAKLISNTADVVFAVDSQWQGRYDNRSVDDIGAAETIAINTFEPTRGGIAEFTGLVYLSAAAAEHLFSLTEVDIGSTLLDVVECLKASGFSVKMQDVEGDWAEFNSPADIARFILGTKAETLSRLEHLVSKSHIGKQVSFTKGQWKGNSNSLISVVQEKFGETQLIVRSSSKAEDNWNSSNAGGFQSLLGIDATSELGIREAVESVIMSYGKNSTNDDQVLLQEFLQDVRFSGVAFTCGLETGSPYYRVNFDDKTKSTESVTSGTQADLRTIILSRHFTERIDPVEPQLVRVLKAIQELESLLEFDKLDIEFAVDQNGIVHIFQVRPVTVDHSEFEVDDEVLLNSLLRNIDRFESQNSSSVVVFGETNIFGNMSDWNPAEIIGTRPRPLAFSLYRELITNEVWATQRSEFGYRDVRPYPLILSFSGQPYVDVRASLNSFIPASLSDTLAEKLANVYLNILSDNPQLHDKIEFDVAFTVWSPTFQNEATKRLAPFGITQVEITQLENALKKINCAAFTRLPADIQSVKELQRRRDALENAPLPTIDLIYALLDDCRRYGTLAFSHAARAGFVAATLLKSFVSKGILSERRRQEFMKSVKTVSSDFELYRYRFSIGDLSKADLIENFGHLRPGTYEVMAQAYWENPEAYLISDTVKKPVKSKGFTFNLTETEKVQEVLSEMGALQTPTELLHYMLDATQAREAVKFDFTKSLSRALDACITLGKELKLSRSDVSFLEFHDLEELKLNATGAESIIGRVKRRRQEHVLTQLVELPSLITKQNDFYCFERLTSQPNFITTLCVESEVKLVENSEPFELSGKVVLIPQADPGYDWLFGHRIAGLITQYGGANSHMAIRAAEFGLPAAIGVGGKLYERFARTKRLQLDCANQVIRELL